MFRLIVLLVFVLVGGIGRVCAQDSDKQFPLTDRDAWAFMLSANEEDALHILSDYKCPLWLDTYSLSGVGQFDKTSTDISCSYRDKEQTAAITYYYSWYGGPLDLEEQIEGLKPTIASQWATGEIVSEGAIALPFGEQSFDCQHTVLAVSLSEQAKGETGVWLCNIGQWVFKIRMTYPLSTGRPVVDNQVFLTSQKAVLPSLPACDRVLADFANASGVVSTADRGVSGLVSGLSQAAKGVVGDALFAAPEPAGCVSQTFDAGPLGVIVLLNPDSANQPMSAHITSIEAGPGSAQAWLQKSSLSLESSQNGYELWAPTEDGGVGLYEVYDALPRPDLLEQHLIEVLNGTRPIISGFRVDEDGNMVITSPAEDK